MADAALVTGQGEATHHWLQQRMTAGANLVLMLWFMISILLLPAYDFATLTAWIAQPFVVVPMLLLIVTTFYHFTLGVQVVIDDYQHNETRVVLLVLLNYFAYAAGALGLFSILKIALSAGTGAI
jgi:succinate dehydrogenase / fumarate reductase membrane anchor subunit